MDVDDVELTPTETKALRRYVALPAWTTVLLTLDRDEVRAHRRMDALEYVETHAGKYQNEGKVSSPRVNVYCALYFFSSSL
jgi:hypothetical protein